MASAVDRLEAVVAAGWGYDSERTRDGFILTLKKGRQRERFASTTFDENIVKAERFLGLDAPTEMAGQLDLFSAATA